MHHGRWLAIGEKDCEVNYRNWRLRKSVGPDEELLRSRGQLLQCKALCVADSSRNVDHCTSFSTRLFLDIVSEGESFDFFVHDKVVRLQICVHT